jgi:hypothetical protein
MNTAFDSEGHVESMMRLMNDHGGIKERVK